MTGALLVDKPAGPTSHDVVAFARRLLETSRIGHTGTLDPLATGLLVLLAGAATRLSRFLVADEKEYIADVRLGIATPTYDAQSLPDAGESGRPNLPSVLEIERALDRFRGTFPQVPPPYSAKKIDGIRAYEKARRNEGVRLAAVDVTVRELEWLDAPRSGLEPPAPSLLVLRVVASAGFYVRSLAHDLGQALGCGAHLEALRRTRVGRFRIEEAAGLDQLQADPDPAARLIPVNALLAHLPTVRLTEEGLRRAVHGNALGPGHLEKGGCPLFRESGVGFPEESGTFAPNGGGLDPEKGTATFFGVLDAAGTPIAVAERRPDGLLHPLVVLG